MKRLFLVIVLFTLPMLACAITPEIEAILALVQFEIGTTIQEDGSGTVELGVGSNEKKEDGEFLVECTDDQLEDLPAGAVITEEVIDDLRWCRIRLPFSDLSELGGLFQESSENAGEDSGFELQPNCLLISDGVLYYDLSLITDDTAEPADTGETTDTSFFIPYTVVVPGPIHFHNADDRQDNALTWNMITATDGFRINLAAGDSCPEQTAGSGISGSVAGAIADGDGDGVLDDADLCRNTPTDTSVDSDGCPITPTAVLTTTSVITATPVVTTTPAITIKPVITTTPAIITTTVVTTTPVMTTTPGIAVEDDPQQAVGDNGFVLDLVPAGEVLGSFSVIQTAELLDAPGDPQSFKMEVSYVVTDGPFGFDELFELQSNISGPGALPAQMQVYLVGETAAALVDGDWTVLPRDDPQSDDLLGGMDTPLLDLGPSANFWETEVWQAGQQLNWQAVETTEYGGVPSVHYVVLDLPVETDTVTVLEMDVWVSLENSYVVAYEATVQADEGTIYASSLTQELDDDFSVTLPPDAPELPDAAGHPPVSPPESELVLLFADEFSDPESGWHVGDYDHGWMDYEGGVFVFYALDPNDTLWSQLNRSFDNTSLVVEATQVLAPTNNNAAYGVACRVGADGFGGYLFLITVDGDYAILKDTAEEYVTLVDWTDSDTIRQGEETNVLAVLCDGSSLSLSVNGEQLAQVNDSQYSGGDIALLAMTFEDEAAETQFDNLEVRAVSPSPSERIVRPRQIPHRPAGDSVTGQAPMPDDAVVITAMEGLTFYTTVMGVQDVADFYLDTMSGLGWEYDGLLSQGDEEFALLVFYDSADTELRFLINHEGDGTEVTILETLAE